jgi:hypothetical protein
LLIRIHQGDVFLIVFHRFLAFDPNIASLLIEGLLIPLFFLILLVVPR